MSKFLKICVEYWCLAWMNWVTQDAQSSNMSARGIELAQWLIH